MHIIVLSLFCFRLLHCSQQFVLSPFEVSVFLPDVFVFVFTQLLRQFRRMLPASIEECLVTNPEFSSTLFSQGLSCCFKGWFCPGISQHKSVPISPCSPLLGSATDTDTLVLATKVVLCLAILFQIVPKISIKVMSPLSLLDRLPFALMTAYVCLKVTKCGYAFPDSV